MEETTREYRKSIMHVLKDVQDIVVLRRIYLIALTAGQDRKATVLTQVDADACEEVTGRLLGEDSDNEYWQEAYSLESNRSCREDKMQYADQVTEMLKRANQRAVKEIYYFVQGYIGKDVQDGD